MGRNHRGIVGYPVGKALACYLVAATALLGAPPWEAVAALAPTTLAALGFSAQEVRARLEALDDQRLHEVAERMDGLVAAGEPFTAALTVALYLAALVVVGVGWVIYKLVAAIVRSSSAPETPTGPAGDPLPQYGKDAPPEAPKCGGYRERPSGANPGIPFNPAAPRPPC